MLARWSPLSLDRFRRVVTPGGTGAPGVRWLESPAAEAPSAYTYGREGCVAPTDNRAADGLHRYEQQRSYDGRHSLARATCISTARDYQRPCPSATLWHATRVLS